MTEDAAVEEPQVRPFSEFLLTQANGSTHDELSVSLHDLVAAVRETGKGGKLQLTIDVKPLSKSDDRALSITANVAVKRPATEAPTSVFFVDNDGNLCRNDPRQMQLPLREVETRRQQAKEVSK